jgi:hypothetical protein
MAVGVLIGGIRVGCWRQDGHFLGRAPQGEYLKKLECANKGGQLQILPA